MGGKKSVQRIRITDATALRLPDRGGVGVEQGSYAEKIQNCRDTCAFFKGIMDGTLFEKKAS